jgi:hypothetical protein
MAEVTVQNGAKLGTLAERINAEHLAYEASVRAALGRLESALDHAMDAGDLLLEAKEECGHGTWIPWLKANCKTLSVRRTQEYMYLAERREYLEKVKARGSAFSSIGSALEFLRLEAKIAAGHRPEGLPVAPGPSVPGVMTTELPIEAKSRRAKERAEQRLTRKAEFALRTGNLDPPGDLTNEEAQQWLGAVYRAQHVREANLPNVLDIVGHQLHILSSHADPEATGRYLTEQRVGYEEAEKRAEQLAELHEGAAWLQRVLEEAERMQGGE